MQLSALIINCTFLNQCRVMHYSHGFSSQKTHILTYEHPESNKRVFQTEYAWNIVDLQLCECSYRAKALLDYELEATCQPLSAYRTPEEARWEPCCAPLQSRHAQPIFLHSDKSKLTPSAFHNPGRKMCLNALRSQ